MKTEFYRQKFQRFSPQFAPFLASDELRVLENWTIQYELSFQQIKMISEAIIDLRNWKTTSLQEWHQNHLPFQSKKEFWEDITQHIDTLRQQPPVYLDTEKKALTAPHFDVIFEDLQSPVFKPCPTTAPEWICCGLKVIDVVENCNLGCSYCILQDFYPDNKIRIANNLHERLAQVALEPNQRYRITTGEYSDSLMWGNAGNLLEELCLFAKEHPNCLLEMKTKSTNITWLRKNREQVPPNFMVSWSLNPQVVISNEEAKTPTLTARLQAARSLANEGIKIGWHIHPILYFSGYEKEYVQLGQRIQEEFAPKEIVAFSLGTLNFIKSQLHLFNYYIVIYFFSYALF
ncbi:MAG: spore photoproduct lyase family protein, partial [Planctomycetota bacterium]